MYSVTSNILIPAVTLDICSNAYIEPEHIDSKHIDPEHIGPELVESLGGLTVHILVDHRPSDRNQRCKCLTAVKPS